MAFGLRRIPHFVAVVNPLTGGYDVVVPRVPDRGTHLCGQLLDPLLTILHPVKEEYRQLPLKPPLPPTPSPLISPPNYRPIYRCKQKNTSDYKPPDVSPPLACIEVNTIFYEVLELNLNPVNAKSTLVSTAIPCFTPMSFF